MGSLCVKINWLFFDHDSSKIVSSRGEKILSDDSIDLDKFVEENKEI